MSVRVFNETIIDGPSAAESVALQIEPVRAGYWKERPERCEKRDRQLAGILHAHVLNMDLTSAENSKNVRLACGLVLAIICLAIWFRFVVNRTVTKVAHSMTGGLSLIENIDSVMNNLDRLGMNQRAFLYTGDERFAGQVAESIVAISNNLESLKQISINDGPLERKVTQLSHRINWALDSIEKTYEFQQHLGSGAAIALLDTDDGVEDAKEEARSLKKAATDGMFERVRTEREVRSILEELF